MEDLLNLTKRIEITDILKTLKFGFEKNKENLPINIHYPRDNGYYESDEEMINYGNYQSDEEILDWMKYFWKQSLHFERGICYTFDGVAITLNQTGNGIIATMDRKATSLSMYKGEMLSLDVTFDVSFDNFHYTCNFL